MSATTEPDAQNLRQIRSRAHPDCVVCGQEQPAGLGLRFELREDGSVCAHFQAGEPLQGYPSLLHGGVTSSLLDGAMTNCLFAHGIEAVTAELKVRFRHPITVEDSMQISAWISRSQSPLFVVDARICQGGVVKARGTGKFMLRRREANS
jgi:acyl-coenzyme A thioesterase PaaI-like protein